MSGMVEAAHTAVEVDPNHIYRYNGAVIPGVTAVLKACGIISDAWFTEQAAWRGSVIHRLLELSDLGDLALDWKADYMPEQAEELDGYLAAWNKFRGETDFRTIAIEQPRISTDKRFAGTPDRIGEIYDGTEVLADIKTGHLQPWAALQLAAYSELCGVYKRVAVAIRPDGTYSIKQYNVADRRRDLGIFLAALAVYEWKEAHS